MDNKIRLDLETNIVGKNIKKLRVSNKYTQEILAAKMQLEDCDISRGAIAQTECGARNISVKEIRALIKIFDVDYKDLLE